LHEEIAAADDSFESDDNDESFRSIVEVSSLDPRAAARAAAILKMNHAYIESGVLPDGTPAPVSRSRRGSVASRYSTPGRGTERSRFFDSEEVSRTISKNELLHEAELDIANSSMHYPRSVSRLPSRTESPALAIPGGWTRTPKRKHRESFEREHNVDIEHEAAEASFTERAWTVSDWRHLEKVYRAEHAKYLTERNVVPLPSWSPWPTRPAAPTEWDPTRVIDAFVAKEGLKQSEMVGEFSR
jgi:hypothetical protein